METTNYPSSIHTQERIVGETKLFIASNSINVIQELVLPFVHESIQWGQIGIGNEDIVTGISCPLGPYQIGAFLENCGRSYGATLIDIKHEVLEDIAQRTDIYISKRQLHDNPKNQKAWNQYLQRTQNSNIDIFEPEGGLKFVDTVSIEKQKASLAEGIIKTEIPFSFINALNDNRIQLIQADISQPTLDLPREKLHYLDMINVLYQLDNPRDQWFAMQHCANLLKPNGILLINESKNINKKFLQGHGGAWPETVISDKLRLNVIQDIPSGDGFYWTVFKKSA